LSDRFARQAGSADSNHTWPRRSASFAAIGAWIDSAGDGVDSIVHSSGCCFASVWAETGATASPVTPASDTIAARARVSKADLNMRISTVTPAREDDRLLAPFPLRRRLLARLVDRDVPAMRQRRLAVG
jgi:hypothetical protein